MTTPSVPDHAGRAWDILSGNQAQAFGVAAVVVLLLVIVGVVVVIHKIGLSVYEKIIRPAQAASVEQATLLAQASSDARQAAESNRISQSIGRERDIITGESIRRLDALAQRLDDSIDRHGALVDRQQAG